EFNVNLLSKSIGYSIERKKVEEKILASEDNYRQMFYKNPFPMWINDEDNLKILEVNDAAILKYGYDRNEFLALDLNDIHLGPLATGSFYGKDLLQEKRWQHRKKNGEIIIVEFTYYPISYFEITAMQAQINDITENIRLENELNLKKQQLVEAVLHTQETERKKIGGELHDNINQILTAVSLNLGFALENPEHSERLIQKCITNTSTAIEEIRKLSKELILPGNLKELGLRNSIEDLLKEILMLSNIQYNLYASGDEESFITEEHKLTLYRIIQEQLNNILKHAEASSVMVYLLASPTSIQLIIADDGKGFNSGKRRNGIGITNIISRAELFDGTVKLDSTPGQGCKLEVTLRSKKILPQPITPLQISLLSN
ncbi:MAG: PAS domain S-box protein, partial [Flavisolibacter sp.]